MLAVRSSASVCHFSIGVFCLVLNFKYTLSCFTPCIFLLITFVFSFHILSQSKKMFFVIDLCLNLNLIVNSFKYETGCEIESESGFDVKADCPPVPPVFPCR